MVDSIPPLVVVPEYISTQVLIPYFFRNTEKGPTAKEISLWPLHSSRLPFFRIKSHRRTFRPFFTYALLYDEPIKTTPTTFLHRTSTKTKNYAIPWMDRPRRVTTNLEVAHQSWLVRCSPHPSRFSRIIENLDLFSRKPQHVIEISSCHHENLDLSP